MSYTPGPWRLTRTHCGSSAESGSVCIVTDFPAPTKKHPERTEESAIHCEGHGYDEYCLLPNAADAVLIAAAPDLLEALEALFNSPALSVFRKAGPHGTKEDAPAIARARLALAKARGEVTA